MSLLNLEPKNLWKNFSEMCAIPHPSKFETKIIEFACSFGNQLKLETKVDSIGNVIICKPATPGYENRKTVVLQAHLDMVPQKNSDTNFDFTTDPIEAYVDGDWVTAKGTTLGADNGIGAAAAMAVLEDKELEHGPLEVLLTIDEETGMTGAFQLEEDALKADILLNLDTEDEHEICVGCAGGLNANIEFKSPLTICPTEMQAFEIAMTGLKGGHSGMDIVLGRGNANKLMNRLLYMVNAEMDLRISSINGGSLRNAIPRESFVVCIVPNQKVKKFNKLVELFLGQIRTELSVVEPDFNLKITQVHTPEKVYQREVIDKVINAVYACPNGVVRMNDEMPDLVETSTNMAIVKTSGETIKIQCLLRSSVDSAKDDLANAIQSTFDLAGATTVFTGSYPGWKPNMQAGILSVVREQFEKQYGEKPNVQAVHAGLECGIIGAKYPKMEMVSFGPTICFPHSPDEKVHIQSVKRFWNLLCEILINVPLK